MRNPASLLENGTHKPLWDFDIQTNHLISARIADLLVINNKKKTWKNLEFAIPADHGLKLKESEKKAKYLDPAWELKKKTMENESDGYTNLDCCFRYSNKGDS